MSTEVENNLFSTIRKQEIVNSNGVKYTQFKKELTPIFSKVWRDIILGYLFLILILVGVAYIQLNYKEWFWLSIPIGALALGYVIAYIHLFIHEAAHYNIAKDRKRNDLLANIFVGLIVGMDIKFYRLIHFDHHRHLGTVHDTEKTYFDALNLRFIIESLTGIRVIKVMMNRNEKVGTKKEVDQDVLAQNKKMFYAGAFLNLIIVVLFFAFGLWQVAITWLIGMGIMFPFFASLRQLLEHRGDNADATTNYNNEDHGEQNRMFGTGLIARTFGGAGFNRHMLHHWDPQVSYTRLKELEEFLSDTQMADDLRKHNTTYSRTFFKLYK